MKLWSIPVEKLSPGATYPPNERREIVLWDLGGHEEYRLIHQLFLHDTTVALVLLDPTRGQSAFAEVEEWNKRLERQLHGRRIAKLLVGTKYDQRRAIVNKQRLESLVDGCRFITYLDVSARTGFGVKELKAELSRLIDWTALVRTRRPELFQGIRDAIERRSLRGEVVVRVSDLEAEVAELYPDRSDRDAIDSVVDQLSLQGLITAVQFAQVTRQ